MQDEELGLLFKLISNAQKKMVDNDMKNIDITMMQGMVLGYITSRSPEMTSPVDIERKFDLRHPTVSGILKRLEQNGFVEFDSDVHDRRKKLVHITEKALLLRDNVRLHQREMDERIKAGFSEDEVETLQRLLKRVLVNLTEEQQ